MRGRVDPSHLVPVARLGQVVEGAAPDGVHRLVDAPRPRDGDEGQRRVGVADVVQELEPVHALHADVADDDVDGHARPCRGRRASSAHPVHQERRSCARGGSAFRARPPAPVDERLRLDGRELLFTSIPDEDRAHRAILWPMAAHKTQITGPASLVHLPTTGDRWLTRMASSGPSRGGATSRGRPLGPSSPYPRRGPKRPGKRPSTREGAR